MNHYDKNKFLNIGTGDDISIKELAYKLKKIIGYKGKLVFDKTKPDGMPKKKLDVSKIEKLGWKSKINLEKGLKLTYQYYLSKII